MALNKSDKNVITLVRAAAAAGVGYIVMRDAVLRKKVHGWQDGRGRWWVDRLDLRRFIRARAAGGRSPVSAQPTAAADVR